MSEFFFYVSASLFVFICVFLILLVLIQKGRGGGLSGALGGAGGSTAFGTKTGDVLTWTTSVVFGIFIALAVTMNLITDYQRKQTAAIPPTLPMMPANQPGNATPLAPTPAAPSFPSPTR